MMLRLARFRFPATRWILLAALSLALPAATATAQELPRVRVTQAETIRAMRYSNNEIWRLTRAEVGTVYEYLYVEGDQVQFDPSNWYLVLLPRDAFGTQWLGWISGKNLEPAPPRPSTTAAAAPAAPAMTTAPTVAPTPAPASETARPAEASTPARASTDASPLRPIQEVVLLFAFDRSDLSEAAKHTLSTNLSSGAEAASLSFSLGGHADATGPDDYNHKLGLARANAVREYIVDQLKVSPDRISVTSFGETQPVAPNTTRAGRADNRRVVVTVTAPAPVAAR